MTEMGELRRAGTSRDHILNAAVAELAAKSIDGFTLEGVAIRAGIEDFAVKQLWPNTEALIVAALMEFGEQHVPMPDTGTLRGDLLEYARSYAEAMNSPIGRRLVDALIVRPTDWDVGGTRAGFLDTRNDRAIAIMRRGIERGECLPGTDPVRAADLIGAALCLPVMLYDRPITEADCEFVLDTILNGVATHRDSHNT